MTHRMIDLVVAGLTVIDLSCEEALRVRRIGARRRSSNKFGLDAVAVGLRSRN
jgi:hypothetical protein